MIKVGAKHGLSKVLIILLLSSCISMQAQIDSGNATIDKYVKVEKLSEKVLVIKTGVFYFDAVTVVSTEKGIVVFDAGLSPSLTKKYREIIEKEFGRNDFTYLINTHGHWDHTNGNKVFKDADIMAHESCKTDMYNSYSDKEKLFALYNSVIKRLDDSLKDADPNSDYGKQVLYRLELFITGLADLDADYTFSYPDLTFNDELTLDMGDVTFKFYYFGKAHSQSDIVTYIPEEKLLMAGDLFNSGGSVNFSQLNAGNVTKPDVEQWYKTMQILLSDECKIDRIIDGHAAYLTKDDLVAFNSNVEYLWKEFQMGRELSARIGLENAFRSSGLQAMVEKYSDMKTIDKDKYFYFERSLIDFGYHLLQENETKGAIEVFKIVVEQFPNSSNAYDSLGEAYMEDGNNIFAVKYYKKSLELNPNNENAKEILNRLEKTEQ